MITVAVIAASPVLLAGLQQILSGREILVRAAASDLLELDVRLDDLDVLVMCIAEEEDTLQTVFEKIISVQKPALLLLVEQTIKLLDPVLEDLPAWGLLPLDASPGELVAAIHSLAEGMVVLHPDFLPQLLGQTWNVEAHHGPGPSQGIPREDLTPRERQVLQHLAEGLPNKQVAAGLGISENTVKFHVASIYSKLGATNRMEAVREGVRKGLIVL